MIGVTGPAAPPEDPVLRGFTLIELLVVLVLLGLAVGLVAPALQPPRPNEEPLIAPLLRAGRAAAVARGEPTVLHVDASGQWRVDGVGSRGSQPLTSGTLSAPVPRAFSITFSPLGTCAPDIRSGASEALPVDRLTCELRRE